MKHQLLFQDFLQVLLTGLAYVRKFVVNRGQQENELFLNLSSQYLEKVVNYFSNLNRC